MNITDYIPTTLLKPFIKTYKIIESQGELLNRVLPDSSLAIAFRLKGQVNYVADNHLHPLPSTVISGLRTSVRLINYVKDTTTIIVQFKEAGATAFFKAPLHELFEDTIALDHLINRQQISLIEEQLSEAGNNRQRINIIEHFLCSILYPKRQDELITTAIEKIHATKGAIKMKALAGSLYLSQDAFEKRFRKTIGTSPKQFSSIIRMKSIIHSQQTIHTLTDIALGAGYFDQPHFNNSFKRFTGLSPTDFFKSSPTW
jgi:AraC-like DNA-binding protein